MADHEITTCYTKSGSAFNNVEEAMVQLMSDSSQSETTLAEHTTYVDGQSNFTETRALTSNGEPVASGTAGNGFRIVRTWTQSKLLERQTAGPGTDSSLHATVAGSGWAVTHVDVEPGTANVNPHWGGDGTGDTVGATQGVEGI